MKDILVNEDYVYIYNVSIIMYEIIMEYKNSYLLVTG